MAGDTLEIVLLFEFRLVLEPLLECRGQLEVAAVVAVRVVVEELRFRALRDVWERPYILPHFAHFSGGMTDQTHLRISLLRASLKGMTITARRVRDAVLRPRVRISGHLRIL